MRGLNITNKDVGDAVYAEMQTRVSVRVWLRKYEANGVVEALVKVLDVQTDYRERLWQSVKTAREQVRLATLSPLQALEADFDLSNAEVALAETLRWCWDKWPTGIDRDLVEDAQREIQRILKDRE